jgi:hypothetical protein
MIAIMKPFLAAEGIVCMVFLWETAHHGAKMHLTDCDINCVTSFCVIQARHTPSPS